MNVIIREILISSVNIVIDCDFIALEWCIFIVTWVITPESFRDSEIE